MYLGVHSGCELLVVIYFICCIVCGVVLVVLLSLNTSVVLLCTVHRSAYVCARVCACVCACVCMCVCLLIKHLFVQCTYCLSTMQFKVTVLEEGDGVSLSVQFLIPPNVTFRVTKKHPIEVCAPILMVTMVIHISF